MLKIFKRLFFAILFCLSFSVNVYASDVVSYEINEFSNNTSVTGKLPTVTTSNENLNKLINAEIKNIYTTRSDSAKNSNAKSLTFSYEVYNNKNLTSIVIESKVSKLKNIKNINTIVYDNDKIYTLDTYLTSTQLKLFNKQINEQIKQSPQDYKVTEVVLNDKTSFYVKNNIVYAIFEGESISSNTEATVFAFKNTNVDTYVLKKSKYILQTSTQAKFVPIREVYSNLGYNVKYKDKQILITDNEGKKIAIFDTMEEVTAIPQNKSTTFSKTVLTTGYRAYIIDGVSYTTLATVQSTTSAVYEINANGDVVFTISK